MPLPLSSKMEAFLGHRVDEAVKDIAIDLKIKTASELLDRAATPLLTRDRKPKPVVVVYQQKSANVPQ